MTIIKRLLSEDDGATAIEYALLAALIGIFCVGAFSYLGDEMSDLFGESGGSVEGAWDTASAGTKSHTLD
jgi:pilus assembly protein Flp/PilA